jgi:acyl-CoA synthetase (AMP-forming)/AMP-acid ligase II
MTVRFVADLGRHGDAPALVHDGGSLSYAELDARVTRFRDGLGSRRLLVAVEAEPSEHAVVGYLGALAGGHAVALPPAGDGAAVTAFRDAFRPDATWRRAGGRWRLECETRVGPEPHPDLAVILTTSGSTGAGKAVRLSAGAVEANARSIAGYLGLRSDDRAALVLPLHYAYGLSVLHAHLTAGASVWLAGGSVTDADFPARYAAAGCTNLPGVPYTFDLLERSGAFASIPVPRFMTVAGGRMEPDAVTRWSSRLEAGGGRFFVMYGQTEATARIAYVPPEAAGRASDAIGIAIPGGRLSLVDEAGRPVTAPGAVGELVYHGPNVMMGYATGRDDLSRGPEVDALATGDLATLGPDGFYRIVGRKRRMSKIAGVRIGHDALEAALAREGIAAAVVGDDTRLAAFFTGDADAGHVRGRLAVLARVTARHVEAVRLEALPRRPTGKVDYEALRAMLGDKARARPVAVDLGEAFRQVFYPRPVRETDSFLSLGGDSLRHVELSMELERRLGRAPDGWEGMTLADLERSGSARPGGRSSIGVEHVIRALAILLVVTQHATLLPIPGGSAAMMVLIGHGLARFQRDALVAGDLARFFRPLGRVLLPYGLVLAGYTLAWGQVPWASALLVSTFGYGLPEHHTMMPYLYWFVEVYAQLLVATAGLFALPPVRRLGASDPFRLGLVLLAGAVAARIVLPQAWPLDGRQIFTLPWVGYLAALGWCAATADTARRKMAVIAAAVVILPCTAYLGGNWIGSWVKYGLQLPVLSALLYLPRVRLPRAVAALVLPVAAASYHVYLFHRLVPEQLLAPLGPHLAGWAFTALSIVGGVAAGLVVHAVQSAVLARLSAARVDDRGHAASTVAVRT